MGQVIFHLVCLLSQLQIFCWFVDSFICLLMSNGNINKKTAIAYQLLGQLIITTFKIFNKVFSLEKELNEQRHRFF